MIVRIEKLREAPTPEFPDNIEIGYTKTGACPALPVVGQCFWVGTLRTSTVKEIIDANTIRTNNSIYRWNEVKTIENV